MNHPAVLLIGPTAVGKSTLLDRALADFPQLIDIVTYTTRHQRKGESQGHPYHFVTEPQFKKLIAENFFVEWANVHGKLYGTPRDQVLKAWEQGRVVIIDIDVQGAKKFRDDYPGITTVFIMPPSIDALRLRFKKRGTTSEEDLNARLESAQREMAQAKDFDRVLINDDFEVAYAEFRKVIEKLLKNQ
jgi:guanylate kinase